MSRPLTLQVPDEVFNSLDAEARAVGQSIHDLAVDVLKSHRSAALHPSNGNSSRAEGLARLLSHCGLVSVGDPSGANNEAIDRDLAREYESTHEE